MDSSGLLDKLKKVPKFYFYILGALLLAVLIIAWLMFGGKSPMEVSLDKGVKARFSATLKDSDIQREKDGKLLWKFHVKEAVNDQVERKAILKGITGRVYREDGTYIDVSADTGEMTANQQDFMLKDHVLAVHSGDGSKLMADMITWNQPKEIITGIGHVQMWHGQWYAQGDKAITTSAFKKLRLVGNAKVEKIQQ